MFDDQPAWWHEAQALEGAGKLQEAEATVLGAVDHIGAAAAVAQLYADRMARLIRAGDEPGAREAYRLADQWIGFYASQATSGGEGTALSRERDQFRARLKNAFDTGTPARE